jgi:hypothetical protein
MKTTLLALVAMLTLSFVALAADATGKWTGEIPGGRGNQPVTLNLKASGSTLTGTITMGQAPEAPIEDGKVDGDKISFSRTAPGRDGTPNKQTFTGKVSADSIEITREGGRGPVTFTVKKQ